MADRYPQPLTTFLGRFGNMMPFWRHDDAFLKFLSHKSLAILNTIEFATRTKGFIVVGFIDVVVEEKIIK